VAAELVKLPEKSSVSYRTAYRPGKKAPGASARYIAPTGTIGYVGTQDSVTGLRKNAP